MLIAVDERSLGEHEPPLGAAETTSESRVVYTIVGLSALALLPFLVPRRETMRPT